MCSRIGKCSGTASFGSFVLLQKSSLGWRFESSFAYQVVISSMLNRVDLNKLGHVELIPDEALY